MSVRMRIVAGVAALAALVLSVGTASACCGGCGGGCGYGYGYATYTYYRPVTVYAPVQATYAVDLGPTYAVPAPAVTGPVAEELGYGGYGYGGGYGGGYRGLGYRGRWGYGHRGWGYRGGLVHRAGYRGWGGGYRGFRGGRGRW